MNLKDDEPCICSMDYPASSIHTSLHILFASIALVLSLLLVIEIYHIGNQLYSKKALKSIFIYSLITIIGYDALVISEILNVLKLSCTYIVVFYLAHYAAFYWIGILFILSQLMGSVKYAFVAHDKMCLYKTLKWLLFIVGGNGVLILIFTARKMCHSGGDVGFYFLAAISFLNGCLLITFLLIKYFFIRTYIKERYKKHKQYFHVVMFYLIFNVILCVVYYSVFYRYNDMQTGALIYSLFQSTVIMLFPLIVTLYFAQPAENIEQGTIKCLMNFRDGRRVVFHSSS